MENVVASALAIISGAIVAGPTVTGIAKGTTAILEISVVKPLPDSSLCFLSRTLLLTNCRKEQYRSAADPERIQGNAKHFENHFAAEQNTAADDKCRRSDTDGQLAFFAPGPSGSHRQKH